MLKALFSWNGVLDRRRYLLWTVASLVVPAIAVGSIAVLGRALGRSISAGEPPPLSPALGVLLSLFPLAVLAVFLWSTMVLTAKRLRDIGLPPLPVMMGLAAAALGVKFVLAPLLSGVVVALLTAAWSYGVPLFLLLWPGRSHVRERQIAETFA